MPVLMMPAIAVSHGRINWFAAKASMAVVGLLGVLFAWLLVRRIGGKAAAGGWCGLARRPESFLLGL